MRSSLSHIPPSSTPLLCSLTSSDTVPGCQCNNAVVSVCRSVGRSCKFRPSQQRCHENYGARTRALAADAASKGNINMPQEFALPSFPSSSSLQSVAGAVNFQEHFQCQRRMQNSMASVLQARSTMHCRPKWKTKLPNMTTYKVHTL